MTHLIYTVAIGETYRTLALMLGQSLRLYGYTESLVCLSDAPVNGWESIIVTPEQLKALDMEGGKSQLLKTFPEVLGDITTRADRITYLDSDILCHIPLGDLFDGPGIMVQNRGVPLVGQSAVNLTQYDKRKLPPVAFTPSPGMVSMPGGRVGRKFLDLWGHECASRRMHDGSALAAVLYRSFPDFKFLPNVGFIQKTSQTDKLVHYISGHTAEQIADFAKMTGRTVALPPKPATATSPTTQSPAIPTPKTADCGCTRSKRQENQDDRKE